MEENNKNKFPKRNIVLYVSIVVILICLTYRASYAYFTAFVVNETEPSQAVINTGDLKMKFEDGITYINANDMIIVSAQEAEATNDNVSRFSVTNTGNVRASYKLYLTDYTITENLVSQDFKYKLKIGSQTFTGNFYELFNGVPASSGVISSNSNDRVLNSTPVSIDTGSTDNCELRVWLQEEDHNQISLAEGSFRGTVKLVATTN